MIEYFHQADDPYSRLLAQLLPAFAARYGRADPPLAGPAAG